MGLGGEKARKLNVLVPSSNVRNELGGGYLSVPVGYFPNRLFPLFLI